MHQTLYQALATKIQMKHSSWPEGAHSLANQINYAKYETKIQRKEIKRLK